MCWILMIQVLLLLLLFITLFVISLSAMVAR